jgi:hypothetical protein
MTMVNNENSISLLTSLKRMPILFTFEWLTKKKKTINIKTVILVAFIMYGGLTNE